MLLRGKNCISTCKKKTIAKIDEAQKRKIAAWKKPYQAASVLRRSDRRVPATGGGGGSTLCGFDLGLLDDPPRDRPFFLAGGGASWSSIGRNGEPLPPGESSEGGGNVAIPGSGGEAVLPKSLAPSVEESKIGLMRMAGGIYSG